MHSILFVVVFCFFSFQGHDCFLNRKMTNLIDNIDLNVEDRIYTNIGNSYYCLVFFYTYILHCISLFFDRVKRTNILSESE